MATDIATLKALGYTVEDMGAEWGPEFAGQFRFLLDDGKTEDFGVIQYSEQDAWDDAAQFDVRHTAYLATLV